MTISNPAREQAEAWFARLMAPDCTVVERARFKQWHQHPDHAAAFAATEALWDSLEGLEGDEVLGSYASEALNPEPDPMAPWFEAIERRTQRQAASSPGRARRLPTALAASVVLCTVALGMALRLWPDPPQRYQSGDAVHTVVLSDGSRMQMDLETEVEVDMQSHRRDLHLLQGRAIFAVAHDRSRPFVVDVAGGQITALGTRFQVDRQDADHVMVSLVEGSIALQSSADEAPQGKHRLVLTAGEQARYSRQQGTWSREDANVQSAISWSEGFHVFSATPLSEAVKEINKYSVVKMRLADPSLGGMVVSGNFKMGNAQDIAVALPVVLPVEVSNGPDEIVVSRR